MTPAIHPSGHRDPPENLFQKSEKPFRTNREDSQPATGTGRTVSDPRAESFALLRDPLTGWKIEEEGGAC